MHIRYPEDFKKKCKKMYPNAKALHDALDNGSEWVGRFLSENSSNSLSLEMILKATSLEELQAAAKVEREKCDLYQF